MQLKATPPRSLGEGGPMGGVSPREGLPRGSLREGVLGEGPPRGRVPPRAHRFATRSNISRKKCLVNVAICSAV